MSTIIKFFSFTLWNNQRDNPFLQPASRAAGGVGGSSERHNWARAVGVRVCVMGFLFFARVHALMLEEASCYEKCVSSEISCRAVSHQESMNYPQSFQQVLSNCFGIDFKPKCTASEPRKLFHTRWNSRSTKSTEWPTISLVTRLWRILWNTYWTQRDVGYDSKQHLQQEHFILRG